ncbi:MAG: hypothetical protein KGO01_15475 [Burkholderiales bacterium]|nr:hypothetical protein [Burkholderiales bacterium]
MKRFVQMPGAVKSRPDEVHDRLVAQSAGLRSITDALPARELDSASVESINTTLV